MDAHPLDHVATDPPPLHRTGPAVHALVYYILLVTRRRRPLFAEAAVAARVGELIAARGVEMGLGMQRVQVDPATVTIHVRAPPTLSPHKIVRELSRAVSAPLRAEFAHVRDLDGVFVRDYMVTSMPVPETEGDAFATGIPRRYVPKTIPGESEETGDA